ncbi:MAG: flagellar biosynthetic protein FliR [Vulcanimicrobiaceae bacterium]
MNGTSLLVFARCAGFTFRAPGLSHPTVPPAVRAGLALYLTLAIAPGVRGAQVTNAFSYTIALASEFMLGSAIGMAASLLYDAAYAGGRAIDDYVGVKAIAPNLDLVAPSGYGRIWSLAFTGAYVLLGAYRPTLVFFAESFARIVPGAPFDAHSWAPFALAYAQGILVVGAAVAAPAIALSFVVQIALGALSRTIPRFGTLTLSFPLVFGAALIVTALCVPVVAAQAGHPLLSMPARMP